MSIAVVDQIKQHAYFAGERLAVIDEASGRRWTYAQYHERVAKVSGFLKAKGIEPGDRVAFLALNTSDILDVVYACQRIGAICVAINFRLAPGEVAFILNNSESKLIVLDAVFGQMAEALAGKTSVEHWVISDCVGGDSDYERGVAAADPIYDMHPQTLDDQCMLMYSSGTTGTPKGVIITHGMLYFSAASGARLGQHGVDSVALCNMPLFHIGGLNVTALPVLWGGGAVVIMRIFEPGAALDLISDPDLGITTLFMVPAAYNAVRAHPKAETADFSRILLACAGAEAVPTELIQWYYDRNIIIQEGYGMTETAAAGSILKKEDIPERIGSAGRYLMHSEIRITAPDGTACPPNTTGEIWFRGASVTPGYWRRPDANKEAFVDGWFRSGDVGRVDEEGYIYIEDRIKDMYISGGENVYPAEIENVLYQMPQIAEVAVIGLPDEKWGEVGCVVAVLKEGQSLTLDEILSHCDGNLARYKLPRHLHLTDVLPRTSTGKVQKFTLRETVPAALKL